MKKIWLICLVLALSLVLFAACTPQDSAQGDPNDNGEQVDPNAAADEEQSYTIRVAHVCGTGAPFDIGANYFKDYIEEQTDGRVEVAVHAGDLTTDEAEAVEMCQSGNLEIAWCSTGSLGGFFSDIAIFEMPFLFDDNEHLEKCLDSEFGTYLLNGASDIQGIDVIAFHTDGWRNILTKGVTINSVDDMKGLRIRSMENEICVAMYEALGAVPVTLPSGEIFTSLQTDLVSGEDNSFIYAVADGYIGAIDTACIIHHFYSCGLVVCNESWLNGLSAADQELIRTAAIEAGKYQRACFLEEDEKYIEQYKEQGYTITYPEDIDAWRAAVQPVYDTFLAKYPKWQELVDIVDGLR